MNTLLRYDNGLSGEQRLIFSFLITAAYLYFKDFKIHVGPIENFAFFKGENYFYKRQVGDIIVKDNFYKYVHGTENSYKLSLIVYNTLPYWNEILPLLPLVKDGYTKFTYLRTIFPYELE